MHDSANAATAPVAVIIPCYNYGRFIGSTIETVLAQTLRPAEIIIVDDGSTDQTREVCEQYDGVRYIWKENGGVSSARNLGLAESTSEYVMFPDADDVLSPKAVEILWDANRALGGSAPAVYGSTTRFSDWQGWLDAQSSDVPIPLKLTCTRWPSPDLAEFNS